MRLQTFSYLWESHAGISEPFPGIKLNIVTVFLEPVKVLNPSSPNWHYTQVFYPWLLTECFPSWSMTSRLPVHIIRAFYATLHSHKTPLYIRYHSCTHTVTQTLLMLPTKTSLFSLIIINPLHFTMKSFSGLYSTECNLFKRNLTLNSF